MKKAFFVLIFLSFLSCQENKKKPTLSDSTLSDSTLKDINEIVESIIIEDSLMVLKSQNHPKMLCDSLIKLDLYIPEKTIKEGDLIPPPSFHSVSINSLLNSKITEIPFFTTKDSLFLIQQYTGIQKLALSKMLSEKINTTNKHQEIRKNKSGKYFDYYEMTIPIFSLDKKRAYIELNHYCMGLCGSGGYIWLEKKNGKWKIMAQGRTWIS